MFSNLRHNQCSHLWSLLPKIDWEPLLKRLLAIMRPLCRYKSHVVITMSNHSSKSLPRHALRTYMGILPHTHENKSEVTFNMSPTTYTTVLVPKTLSGPVITALAQKLRIFKLHALQSEPKAFSQEYPTEFSLPLSTWESRIMNPSSQIVVCVILPTIQSSAKANDCEAQRSMLLDSEWAGTFTMIGPVPRHAWIFPNSGQPAPAGEDEEVRWQLTGLFVLPEHRGKGLATKITLASINAGRDLSNKLAPLSTSEDTRHLQEVGSSSECSSKRRISGTIRKTRIRLIVHPDNKEVVGMYLKLGFVDCARYTLREAYIANGDRDFIPKNADQGKWDARFGIGMEYLA